MTDQALIILKEKFGTEFGADAVKEVAAQLNTSYATLSKYLNQYKVGRGKWNLEATVQELEDTYKNSSLNDDLKKRQTNDLLQDNNLLLSQKIELTKDNND